MTPTDLKRYRASALRLIKKFGKEVSWISVQKDEPTNPDEPWFQAPNIETSHPVWMAFLPIELIDKEFRRYRKDVRSFVGSEGAVMESVDFEPKMIDYVLDGSDKRILANFTPIKPDGNVICYIVEFEL